MNQDKIMTCQTYLEIFLCDASPTEVLEHLNYWRMRDTFDASDKGNKKQSSAELTPNSTGASAQRRSRKQRMRESNSEPRALLLWSVDTEILVNLDKRKLVSLEQHPDLLNNVGTMPYCEIQKGDRILKLHRLISLAMTSLGFSESMGAPPKGQLERIAQRLLDGHFPGKGKGKGKGKKAKGDRN